MKFTGLFFLFTFSAILSGFCQNSIMATQVESWVLPTPVSSDYNLNSSYIYLLNPSLLSSVFEGEDLNKGERRDAGIKKGDYPQYMYLAASIKDPVNPNNALTIPLMIHDTRNPSISSRILEYGGRVLENIPDEVLSKGDITAKIKFEAIKSNEARDFWQKTAEISADLGKTATSLLKVGLSGPFLALTNQIMPQVDKGLRSMEKLDDPQKMVSEFYIKLLSKDLGNLYDEKVVGATLYRIHWDVDVPLKSKYFLNFQANKVDDFKNKVPKTTAPYILVVQTKSEYNTDYADLTFTKPYFDKKTKDFKLIQNEDKKAAESDFLEVFSAVLDLRKQIDLFQSSLQTKYTDWIAYARLIDSYHHIGLLKKHAISSLISKDVRLKEKYGKLYTNVQTEIDLWFNAEMLLKFREIGRFLIALDSDSVSLTKSSAQLYKDIELLDFYRERLSQSEIQGRLPKEIESLSSFQKVNEWRNELENVFFKKEFQYSAELTGKDMNLVWLEKCKNQFPLCKSCPNQVSKLTQEFEKTTVNLLNKQFSAISNSLYHTLGCLDASIQFLDKYIDSGRETNQIPPLVIDNLAKDKDELARLVQTYQFIISKDPLHLSLVELQQLMTDFNTRKSKTLIIWDRLRGDIIPSDLKGCSGGLF
ncbi:MAG: hypothetical protein KGQ86_02430 [Bacteroidetes bacterium]|nr:hypothetical protein [Bacteroidota bacterium]